MRLLLETAMRKTFLDSPHSHTRAQRTTAHQQTYRDLYGERVRSPRPSPLRRALHDMGYLLLVAGGIGGWVALIVIVLFPGEW